MPESPRKTNELGSPEVPKNNAAERLREFGIRTRRRNASWRAVARGLPGLTPLIRALTAIRTMAIPTERARRRLERAESEELLQPATTTWMNRHPLMFDALRTHLKGTDRPRILSFGCATGQEAFTLASYLPNANINALDLNPACIVVARRNARKNSDAARITFQCAGAPNPADTESYHAITCLSVMRHGRLDAEMPDSCDGILSFDRFSSTLELLDRALRPGGLLLLWGCNFRLADTVMAQRYRPISVRGMGPQPPPFYGPNGRRLEIPYYADFLFRKL